MSQLNSAEDLRTVYRHASGGAVAKVIDHLDHHCVDFLERSPMMVLSTASRDGVCDGSPKGGRPGFARALDEHRVAWADLSGNNRLDSFENVVENPSVAALFLIPGLDETLRVNGTAELSTDPALCQTFAVDGKPARVVVVVTVAEAYIHCAKAFRRAALWDPTTWPSGDDQLDAICMLRDHASIPVDADEIRVAYDDDVEKTLWSPGSKD